MGYGEGGHKHLLFHEFHTIIAIPLKPGHLARLEGGAGNSSSPPHYRLANPFITQGICSSTPCGKLFVWRFVFSLDNLMIIPHNLFMTNKYYLLYDAAGEYIMDCGSLREVRMLIKYVYIGGRYKRGR